MDQPNECRCLTWVAAVLAAAGCLGCFCFASGELVYAEAPWLLGHRQAPVLLCGLVALAGATLGLWRWWRLGAPGVARARRWERLLAVWSAITGTVLTWFGTAIAVVFLSDVIVNSHGRRLRRSRRVHVPRLRAGAWREREQPLALTAPESLRVVLGQAWRATACKEHAAIASFAQLSLDLLAVGAPPYLLELTHADANDEVRHAATCFAIAAAFDGAQRAPAPFPAARALRPLARSRALALVQIALDSLADGVLNEGMSARILARLAERAAEPALATLLRTMAVDEARHASHSWRVVEWCIEAGGEPVWRAVTRAARHLPTHMQAELDDGASDGRWERFGLQGRALERDAFERTRDAALRKLGELSPVRACA